MNIFEYNEFWVLAGIILGFSLTEISRFIQNKKKKTTLKNALEDELETNYFQLEHKKDTLNNVICALKKNEILPGTSVENADCVFSNNSADIILILEPIERDIIQNIYSRMKIIDQFLNNLEDKLMVCIKDNVAKEPFQSYKKKASEMIDSCEVVQELIKSFLDRNPVDIYERKSNMPISEKKFAGVVTAEIIKKLRGTKPAEEGDSSKL